MNRFASSEKRQVKAYVSTTEYTGFDILGRVTAHKQTTDGNQYTTGYTYSLSGALLEQTYPSGRVVKNVFDGSGDLSMVKTKKTANHGYLYYAHHFTYNAAGAVTSMQLGNGRWENTVFNARLQPTQIALGVTPGATNLLKLDYSYGTTQNNGNVQSQTITIPGVTLPFVQNYTYYTLNRLESADEKPLGWTQTNCGGDPTKCWKQTFKYDRYGNRNFNTSGNNTTTLPQSFDPDIYNPTISTTNNRFEAGQGYSYDSSGNTTVDAEGRTFVYDAENKQVEVIESSVTIGEYFYDGDGKRVKKIAGSEETIFVYDAGGKLIGEYSTVVQTGSNAKTVYTTNDHLGSPRISTDGTGQVISRHDYHPFGEEIARTGYSSDTIRKQFTGYERDDETGLDFAQARMYGGAHGRFSTPDPYNVLLEKERGKDPDERADILIGFISNPQRWNMYVYVVNNPLAFIDPDGQKPRTINVFLDTEVLSKEGLDAWKKWAASKQNENLKINIYEVNESTKGSINEFMKSLTQADTVTIFSGHSARSGDYRFGVKFADGIYLGSQAAGKFRASHSAEGVDIQNPVLAIFSCGFGNGFNDLASSNGTAFVSVVQGQGPGTQLNSGADALNQAAFQFAKSIEAGSWSRANLLGEVDTAKRKSQAGFNMFLKHSEGPSVNAGDHVDYRILPPPRKR